MAARRLRSIVVDCAKPAPLARFWAAVLGYQSRPHAEDADSVCIEPADERERAEKPNVWFEQVPEGKIAKNRLHLDVNLSRLDEVDQFVGLGAHILHPFGSVPDTSWAILADPEGNEFCVFPPE
jgi:predicted enzyme related to lactoylglutathione lyase